MSLIVDNASRDAANIVQEATQLQQAQQQPVLTQSKLQATQKLENDIDAFESTYPGELSAQDEQQLHNDTTSNNESALAQDAETILSSAAIKGATGVAILGASMPAAVAVANASNVTDVTPDQFATSAVLLQNMSPSDRTSFLASVKNPALGAALIKFTSDYADHASAWASGTLDPDFYNTAKGYYPSSANAPPAAQTDASFNSVLPVQPATTTPATANPTSTQTDASFPSNQPANQPANQPTPTPTPAPTAAPTPAPAPPAVSFTADPYAIPAIAAATQAPGTVLSNSQFSAMCVYSVVAGGQSFVDTITDPNAKANVQAFFNANNGQPLGDSLYNAAGPYYQVYSVVANQ